MGAAEVIGIDRRAIVMEGGVIQGASLVAIDHLVAQDGRHATPRGKGLGGAGLRLRRCELPLVETPAQQQREARGDRPAQEDEAAALGLQRMGDPAPDTGVRRVAEAGKAAAEASRAFGTALPGGDARPDVVLGRMRKALKFASQAALISRWRFHSCVLLFRSCGAGAPARGCTVIWKCLARRPVARRSRCGRSPRSHRG